MPGLADENTGPTYEDAVNIIMHNNASPEIMSWIDRTGGTDPQSVVDYAESLQVSADSIAESALDTEQLGNTINQMGEQLEQAQQAVASAKVFNLSKTAQADMFGADMSPQGLAQEQQYIESEPLEELFFNDHSDLDRWLLGKGFPEALTELSQAVSGDVLQLVKDALDDYYQHNLNSEGKLDIASKIYSLLPDAMKGQGPTSSSEDGDMILEAPYRGANAMYEEHVKTSNEQIKALAQRLAKNKKASAKKAFNLSKTAQHHTDTNVILYGPGEKRPDPFMQGQPVSDWHIVERNKGFGQDIDGVWNIDWEAVWRGNVMDKYSRPYRDSKTGEWVGGYIQKRFEVDKWIPEQSNMQLLPGERRKPRLPQYGSTESRLQHMRAKNERGYGPITDTSAPFDWKEASVKVAQSNSDSCPQCDTEVKMDNSGDFNCPQCGNQWEYDGAPYETTSGHHQPTIEQHWQEKQRAMGRDRSAQTNVPFNWKEASSKKKVTSQQTINDGPFRQHSPKPDFKGPFKDRSGRVVYYDPKEGSYYDPNTDMYLSDADIPDMPKTAQVGLPDDTSFSPPVDNFNEPSPNDAQANTVITGFDPAQKSQFIEYYKQNRWGEVYQMLGEATPGMDQASQAALADSVYLKLTHQPSEQEKAPQMMQEAPAAPAPAMPGMPAMASADSKKKDRKITEPFRR